MSRLNLSSVQDGDLIDVLVNPGLSMEACRIANDDCAHDLFWLCGRAERSGEHSLHLVWRHSWDRLPLTRRYWRPGSWSRNLPAITKTAYYGHVVDWRQCIH